MHLFTLMLVLDQFLSYFFHLLVFGGAYDDTCIYYFVFSSNFSFVVDFCFFSHVIGLNLLVEIFWHHNSQFRVSGPPSMSLKF